MVVIEADLNFEMEKMLPKPKIHRRVNVHVVM